MRVESRSPKALAYSTCIEKTVVGVPQRGALYNVFSAAANIIFPDNFVLSLNAASIEMPNGLRISVPAGAFPFSALAAGMPVILGAGRLHIEAIECSLDLSCCEQWDPFIAHSLDVDAELVLRNGKRVKDLIANWSESVSATQAPGFLFSPDLEKVEADSISLATYLCGRGPGLTPAGDDMLVGWMAVGRLLYGPHPTFLDLCQQIMAIACRQTHRLSQCWLGYAVQGCVASPIKALLQALTRLDDRGLESAVARMLEMGATSGYDSIRGILLGCTQYFSGQSLCQPCRWGNW